MILIMIFENLHSFFVEAGELNLVIEVEVCSAIRSYEAALS